MSKQKPKRREPVAPAGQSHNTPRPSFDPAALADRAGCQKEAMQKVEQHDILFLLGSAGTGKAQPLYSALYTKTGPIRMGEVRVGDEIASVDGTFCHVTGVYPQGDRPVHRVHFTDGTHVDCCGEHLWAVYTRDGGWKGAKVVTTDVIAAKCRRKDGSRVLSVESCQPVKFNEKNFPIPPYTLGLLLAEGCFTGDNVVFSSAEAEIVNQIRSELADGYTIKSKEKGGGSHSADHRIVRTKRKNAPNDYRLKLESLALWKKYAYEKHIPSDYLYGSLEQRIALLQGMMDGDGYIESNGVTSYTTTSTQLAKDFSQLVYSLGGATRIVAKAGAKKADGGRHRTSYTCHLSLPCSVIPFRLNRKLARMARRSKYFPKRIVDRVEVLPEVPMQCISVDHPRQLYLTDNFTVTHNTHVSTAIARRRLLTNQVSRVVVTRPAVECGGERLGFLPGEVGNKMHVWLLPFQDVMRQELGTLAEKELASFEVVPLAFIRGRTLSDCVAILDEAQNATVQQLRAYLTRIGHRGKLLVVGDPGQSDLAGGGPHLSILADEMEKRGLAGVVRFPPSAVCRHPLIEGIEKLFAEMPKR